MSGWADEYESAAELTNEAAENLRKINPQHELLKYWFALREELKDGELDSEREEVLQKEMIDRFWNRPDSYEKQPGVVVSTIVMTHYYFALLEAIKECQTKHSRFLNTARQTQRRLVGNNPKGGFLFDICVILCYSLFIPDKAPIMGLSAKGRLFY